MTIERPVENARCWFLNAADRAVEIYVNHRDEAHVTVEPKEDKPAFSIDADADGIYGTYTFEARPAGEPDSEVLGAVSVEFEAGDDYTTVFGQVGPDDYRLSIYEADFSPTGASRLEVHHDALPGRIDWRLAPNPKADSRLPGDERSGSLERGQYQQALDVTPNRYRLEVLVDGEVVAFRRDLALEAGRVLVCHVVGDPKPGMDADRKERHVVEREYQVGTGPERDDEVTSPAEPLSTTDTNRTVEFAIEPVEVYETNPAESAIRATDPDGIVADLGIEDVEPPSSGFLIRDESVERAPTVGGITTGTLRVKSDVPPGSYDVRIVSNPEGPGERVACTIPVEVEPVTVERLRDLVRRYSEAGDVTDAVADDLNAALSDAERSLRGGPGSRGSLAADLRALIEEYERTDGASRTVIEDLRALLDGHEAAPPSQEAVDAACDALSKALTIADENKGHEVSEAATVDLRMETEALQRRLDCN